MKNTLKLQTLAVAASVMAAAGTASADSFVASTSYGGDLFSLYSGNNSWLTDENTANALGGYLAILPTTASFQTVYNGLVGSGFFQGGGGSQQAEAYIGAIPADGTASTTNPNNWSWVTKAPASLYLGVPVTSVVPWTAADAGNFAGGEPNGDSAGLGINRDGTFTFNDENGPTGGYIVETYVPDGGMTASLLGGALVGLAALRRKMVG